MFAVLKRPKAQQSSRLVHQCLDILGFRQCPVKMSRMFAHHIGAACKEFIHRSDKVGDLAEAELPYVQVDLFVDHFLSVLVPQEAPLVCHNAIHPDFG